MFTPIDANKIKVGDPITAELLEDIKDNFNDHELRIQSLSTSGGTVFIFNGDVSFVNYSASRSDIFYYKARQDFSVNDFRAQLFTKDGIAAGTLVLRLEKASTTDFTTPTNMLDQDISFNFATDLNYSEKIAILNPAQNSMLTGEVIRVRVLSIPSEFNGKILMSIGAQ
jgi:hypothetical protein